MVVSAGLSLAGVNCSRCGWRRCASIASQRCTAALTGGISSTPVPGPGLRCTSPHIVIGTCAFRCTRGGGSGRPAALVCVGVRVRGGGLLPWELSRNCTCGVRAGARVQGTLGPGGWGLRGRGRAPKTSKSRRSGERALGRRHQSPRSLAFASSSKGTT